MIIRLDSIDAPELDVYARLTGAQLRSRLEPELGVFIAESPTVIEVALSAGCEPLSMVTDERLLIGGTCELISRMEKDRPELPIYVASGELLREITGFELTRGALAAFRRPKEKGLSELLSGARRIAILESIADSTNVGALFRSAAALGLDAILITPSCCDPLCRRAVRVSMGTALLVPWGRIGECASDWPREGMKTLREMGFATAAMALRSDTVDIDDERLLGEEKLAIILGTEGTGLTDETIGLSDYTVKIPMARGVDSLNVAAAGAIAFWQITRKEK